MSMFGFFDLWQSVVFQLDADQIEAGARNADKPGGLVLYPPWLGGLKQS